MDHKELGTLSEKAIRFLSEYLVDADEWRKPVLFHSIRVGTHLYEAGYSPDIVIAGFLHDVLEDCADVSEHLLAKEFGSEVLRLVKVSTKDDSITDNQKKKEELIVRCVSQGENAAIIKAADILDNMYYYTLTENHDELIGHCQTHAELLFENMPKDWSDPIFTILHEKVAEIKKIETSC